MKQFTQEFIDQLNADKKRPILLFTGEFISGIVNLWSGIGTITHNDVEYIGFGGILLGISSVMAEDEISSNGVVVRLSGIDETIRGLVLNNVAQGKSGKFYIGFIDDDGNIVNDIVNVFEGRLDVPEITDTGSDITINISYESKLKDLQRAKEIRFTSEGQKALFPEDNGFEFVTAIQEWNGNWGSL